MAAGHVGAGIAPHFGNAATPAAEIRMAPSQHSLRPQRCRKSMFEPRAQLSRGEKLLAALWRTRWYDLDGQGMNAAPEFIGKRVVDRAVLRHASQSIELGRPDANTKMSLALRARRRVTHMS